MKNGDKIRITAGEQTVEGTIDMMAANGRLVFVSFGGALSIGGRTLFSNASLRLGEDGRWREAQSGAGIQVAPLQ